MVMKMSGGGGLGGGDSGGGGLGGGGEGGKGGCGASTRNAPDVDGSYL